MEKTFEAYLEDVERFLKEQKPRRAYMEASAGLVALGTAEPMALCVEELRAAAQLYFHSCLLAHQYNDEYYSAFCGEMAIQFLDSLYQRTHDPADKALRSRAIVQSIEPVAPLPDEDELANYRNNGIIMGYYDILENDEGAICVALSEKANATPTAENPVVYYDGGQHAVLFKRENLAIVLDYLHPGVRDSFYRADEILFTHTGPDMKIAEEFVAPLLHTRNMRPVMDGWVAPLESLGPDDDDDDDDDDDNNGKWLPIDSYGDDPEDDVEDDEDW